MIAMMQAIDTRHAHDLGCIGLPPLEHTPDGRIFVQGHMHAILVVVPDVLLNNAPQMGLAQHDHVVPQFSATACNPALRRAVLPRLAIGRSNQHAAEAVQHSRDVSVELPIPFEDQVLGCAIFCEDFS